jgi:DNA topoisomerase-1
MKQNNNSKINNRDKQILLLNYWLSKQFTDNLNLNMNGGGYKWTSFEHNGVMFPPEYSPHKIKLKYKVNENMNEKVELVELNAIAEEYIMLYVKYLETDYVLNKTFNKNFFNDWKKTLGKDSIIKSLEQCDLTEFRQIYLDMKTMKQANTGTSDEEVNSDNKNKDTKYKTAIVDGKPQPVGNFRMEPPGIFLGRGENPKIGKIKSRIYPEDITLNLSKEAKIPELPDFLNTHKWGKIIHDKHAEWLASWRDTITDKYKYVWLGAHSDFKASSDMAKFDLASKLKRKIEAIHKDNEQNLLSTDTKKKQVATAFYFIDKFALRVGNEKSSDETDTVGVTSLRCEHIELKESNQIVLDFLGKDSVRYYNKLSVDEIVYKNIEEFIQGKNKNEDVFDKINSNDINKYLQTFMTNLTAKVFRTYNASSLFQKELKKITKKYAENSDKTLLLDEFNKANAKVAQLCNHQKNVGKNFKDNLTKLDLQLKKVKSDLRKAKENKSSKIASLTIKLQKLKSRKELKQELKNISLGTSKANYIDPRITVAFLKLHNLPIEKVFSSTLRDKFKWAFEVNADYKF